jgi:hypothetical protein
VPKHLITFGLGLIAAVIILRLVAFVVDIALWAGALLIVIGIFWHFISRSEQKA